jgi:hypothetical protein
VCRRLSSGGGFPWASFLVRRGQRSNSKKVRNLTDPEGRRRGNRAAHGTITRWNAGYSCTKCRLFQAPKPGHADDAERKRGCLSRNAGNSWRSSTAASPLGLCSHLSLTPNQVRGLTKTHEEWSTALEKALTATRRGISNMEPTPPTWRVVSAGTVESTGASGWPGTADSRLRIAVDRVLLRCLCGEQGRRWEAPLSRRESA